MTQKRKIEVFSAGCPVCETAIEQIKAIACSSCEVTVLDMNNAEIAKKAESVGVRSVPSVTVDGKLASCCSDKGVDLEALKALGVGRPA